MEHTPIDRDTTLAIARRARWLFIKTRTEIVRVDTHGGVLEDDAADRYLVHEDGFIRVPVLVVDDLLVRGFTEALYTDVFATRGGLRDAGRSSRRGEVFATRGGLRDAGTEFLKSFPHSLNAGRARASER